jgi:hypothetical protein
MPPTINAVRNPFPAKKTVVSYDAEKGDFCKNSLSAAKCGRSARSFCLCYLRGNSVIA